MLLALTLILMLYYAIYYVLCTTILIQYSLFAEADSAEGAPGAAARAGDAGPRTFDTP